jgi:predicted DCC family thiol-disulfide oxidoreductase YuxK
MAVVPKAIRDRLYDVVARTRYRLFGRYDQCLLPRPEWRSRFVE